MSSARAAKPGQEVEIKLKVELAPEIWRRLRALGFQRTSPRHFESNHLFDFPDQRLGRSGRLLRLRREGGRWVLTFKGPPARSANYKVREEIESPVASGDDARRIFESLALREVFSYQKFRTTYVPGPHSRPRGHAELTLDETPIGNFIELEGPRRWIDRVARQFGYTRADYITASYAVLYFEHCRKRGIRPTHMVFRKY